MLAFSDLSRSDNTPLVDYGIVGHSQSFIAEKYRRDDSTIPYLIRCFGKGRHLEEIPSRIIKSTEENGIFDEKYTSMGLCLSCHFKPKPKGITV